MDCALSRDGFVSERPCAGQAAKEGHSNGHSNSHRRLKYAQNKDNTYGDDELHRVFISATWIGNAIQRGARETLKQLSGVLRDFTCSGADQIRSGECACPTDRFAFPSLQGGNQGAPDASAPSHRVNGAVQS